MFTSQTSRNNYTGNGAVDTYAYGFKIFSDDDLLIKVRDTAGAESTLTKTTHYTVSGVGESAGGNIALVNGAFGWLDGDGDLKTGYTLSIRRKLTIKQATDLRNQGSYFPEDVEDQLDKLAMIDLQQQDEIDRSVKLPETIQSSSFNPTFPADLLLSGADKVPMINAAGTAWADADDWPSGDEIASAQAYAVAADASADAAAASETLASQWATKTTGLVAATDASAKAWAIGGTDVTDTAGRGAAKEWATETASTVDGTGYSAKEWAQGTQTRGAASGGSAKDWANYTGGTVDNAEYSAKKYAQDAAASASAVLAALPFNDVVYKTSADSPLTLTAADAGKIFHLNCAGGAITVNLPSIAALTGLQKNIILVKSDSGSNKVTYNRDGTDTIEGGTSGTLDTQGAGILLAADTDQAPDDWTKIEFKTAGGGGGADFEWFPQDNSPVETVLYNSQVFEFEDALSQYLYGEFVVPDNYIAGNQISLKGQFFAPATAGNVLFKTVSTLIRAGTDPSSSTTNQRTSTNAAVALSGSNDIDRAFTCDLTSSTGQINGVSVSPRDRIKFRIERDTATDTAAASAYLYKKGYEVTLR